MTKDPRIDAYIAKAAPFAQPILTHLRALVHRTAPELEETLKWGVPHFTWKGKNVAGFASFKAHAAFMIHGDEKRDDGMGQCGKIRTLTDLPSDKELASRILDARKRIDSDGSAVRAPVPKAPKSDIVMPEDFAAALDKAGAHANFDAFPPGARREYLEWVTGAKRAETRDNRIAQAAEWIAEGKKRNWKYEKC